MDKAADTIDEVISQLEQLIEDCVHTDDRIGYFASLYHKVTVRIRDGIQNNEFQDGRRMEKFDVLFANRYLTAVRQWKNKEQPSGPWMVAFRATQKSSVLVLQQLFLGMNAHINLDLGIAAAQVTASGNIEDIHKDFNSINDILGAMTLEVLNEVTRVSPFISLFGLHATNETFLIQFSISNARDGAWSFAGQLNTSTGPDFDAAIASRAETIKKLAFSLTSPTGLIWITILIIHFFEWKIPGKIIRVLYGSKKKFIHA